MKAAYLIQCHHYPELVNTLLAALDAPESYCYIHVDKHSSILPSLHAGPRVTFVQDRVRVQWSGFSQIRATLALFNSVRRSGQRFEYIHLISGQDLPIYPQTAFAEFLTAHRGSEFVAAELLPKHNWGMSGGLDRLRYYYPEYLNYRKQTLTVKIIRQLYVRLLMLRLRRDISPLLPLYGGSQWFSITHALMDYILDYLDTNPVFYRRFRYTHAADEIFFNTLAMRSPYRDRIANTDLRYIEWVSGRHPKTLREDDYDALRASGRLFARKFDPTVDRAIIDKLLASCIGSPQ
jgi:hypothetical protein